MKRIINTLIFLGITVSLYANNLEKIKSEGVLRIGTTGDYAPMTYWSPEEKEYIGFDIDMAKSFAAFLGVKVQFVNTTWQTLTKDLLENKFNIAMGGICGTEERNKYFLFSAPVMETGKVPLILKKNKDKFKTLKNIDKPDVKIVENNGGTNMKFALENIKHAIILIVPLNKMNFEYILEEKADVFFTDKIEALHKEKTNPKLFAVNPEKSMDNMSKVYLMPKEDIQLAKELNIWLKQVKENGQFNKFLNKALETEY